MSPRRWHVNLAAASAVLLVGFVGARPAAAQASAYQFQADQNQAVDQGDADDGTPPPPENVNGVVVPDEQIPDGFEDQLSPYGSWVNLPGWGWVWQPNESDVGSDFTPYESAGDWEDTADDGWYFDSEYAWGSIPFHYGRWFWQSAYGWMWLPGTVWGPAWVAWRTGGGYVGWAPLGPPGYRWGSRIGASGTAWCFLQGSSFGRSGYEDHLVSGAQVRALYDGSSPVRNMVTVGGARWNAGPRATEISAIGGNATLGGSRRPDQVSGLARVAPAHVGGGSAVAPRSSASPEEGGHSGRQGAYHSPSSMRATPYRTYAYSGGYGRYPTTSYRSYSSGYYAPAGSYRSSGFSGRSTVQAPAQQRPSSDYVSPGGSRGGGGFRGGGGRGGGRR